MMSALIAIALLHWIVLVTPGANVLVVSHLAASGSSRAAFFAGVGVTVVAGIWSALAVLGVGAVFAAHPYLRLTVQVAGGSYLLYVACRLWGSGGSPTAAQTGSLSPAAAFRLGFLTNILNPKSALFFGSVFATALPANPSGLLLFAALLLVGANAFIWHTFLALAFASPRIQRAYERRRKAIRRGAGALVGAFGARLLASAAGELS